MWQLALVMNAGPEKLECFPKLHNLLLLKSRDS